MHPQPPDIFTEKEPDMKTLVISWSFLFIVSIGIASHSSFGQSLSSGLGATSIGPGIQNFADCQTQVIGHREKLIADRMEAKLAKSPALSAEERAIWTADIQALRQVTPKQTTFKAPDAKSPQHYLLGLTDDEQVSINSMHNRYSQENNLACEQKFGGMSRYSSTADKSTQAQYEQDLRKNFGTPIDIATIPVGPLPSPFPKPPAQQAAERRAAQQASRQTAAQSMTACTDAAKGLRLSIMADKMQLRLDGSQGLSAKDRADFEADIKATRDAAAKGLDQVPAVDPSNPNRVLTRLTSQDQIDMISEFGTQYMAKMQECTKR